MSNEVRNLRTVNKLSQQQLAEAMQLPVLQERLAKVGSEPMPMGVDEFGKYFREDVLATAQLMQRVGVKPVE